MDIVHEDVAQELSNGKSIVTELIYGPEEIEKKQRHIEQIQDACYGHSEYLLREEGRVVLYGFFMDDAIETFDLTGELIETQILVREQPEVLRDTLDISQYNPA